MTANSVEDGGTGKLDRLVLWPQFTGPEWQLPTNVHVAECMLVGWRCLPESTDGGPPPAVAMLLATALRKHASLTFASALRPPVGGTFLSGDWRLGRNFVWVTSSTDREAAQGIFDADFFSWTQQGQVVVLGSPGVVLALDERYLELQSDPMLFGELKSAGAHGVLLPGVDGSVAGLYFFNTAISSAVRRELESTAQAMGGRCLVTTGEDFRAQLRS